MTPNIIRTAVVSTLVLGAASLIPAAAQTGDSGRPIVFARAVGKGDPFERSEIFSMASDGAAVTRLTDNAIPDEFPSLSPDGTTIAFARSRNGNADVYVMPAGGGSVRRVTRSAASEALPAWSPDGKWIVFTRALQTQADIFRIRASGGSKAVRLTKTAEAVEFAPEWAPDGGAIAFTKLVASKSLFGIAVMNTDGTRVRWLTQNPDGSGGYNDMHPSWSPDGERVAFVREHGADPFVDLFTVARDGSDVRQLTDFEGLVEAPAWGPDDRIVFMHDNGLGVISADGTGFGMIAQGGRQYWWPDW